MPADELQEVGIGPGDRPRPTYVSAKLDDGVKQTLIELLKDYADCFAWEYHEMPGLDRSIVEHRLPINEGYRTYKQPPRRSHPDGIKQSKTKSSDCMTRASSGP